MIGNIKTLLIGVLALIFLCACIGPVWAMYASANDPTLGLETMDWSAVRTSFLVALLCGFIAFVLIATNSDGEEKRRPMTNSELRRMYYPDYMNKQEAIREIKAEKETYNNAMRGAGAWAGANEYVDYDGHLRKIEKGRLLDDYPNIADDGIIKKNVAPARKTNVRRSTIEIRKR